MANDQKTAEIIALAKQLPKEDMTALLTIMECMAARRLPTRKEFRSLLDIVPTWPEAAQKTAWASITKYRA